MKYSSKHFEITKRFWDGTKKIKELDENRKEVEKVIQFKFDEDGKKAAIERAVFDLMARTLTPTGAEGKFSTAVVEPLQQKLDEWFQLPEKEVNEESFDAWHNKTCEVVLKVLNIYYTNDKEGKVPVQYGKAQKIVNMTMKTLYCLPGSEMYEKHFDYCHIALDSFTLEWFKRNVITWCEACYNEWIKSVQKAAFDSALGKRWLQDRGKKHEDTVMKERILECLPQETEELAQYLCKQKLDAVKLSDEGQLTLIPEPYFDQIREEELRKVAAGKYFPAKLASSRILSWSVISKQGSFYFGYDEYIRWTRIYFATNHTYTDKEKQKALTPFQAEFYIWSEIQLEMAAEALYGQDIGKLQAIEKAKSSSWKAQWQANKVDSKDINGQFDWCKSMFKKQSLEYKMDSLQSRVKELCDALKQLD